MNSKIMNKTKYYYNTTPMADFRSLCEQFTGKALQSPYRSTVPQLSLVGHSEADWNSLMYSLGAPDDASLHFEYCVPSPKLGGNPSQTDMMIFSESTVWAVESKWTEPQYETVAERISKPEDDGADPRITVKGWLQHFRPFTTHDLRIEDFSGVVYQTLHRAASACAVATARKLCPEVVYLHFHPSPRKDTSTTAQYKADLTDLHGILGKPTRLTFSVVEMPMAPTPLFESIMNLDKNAPATSQLVLDALCQGALFVFGKPIITRI